MFLFARLRTAWDPLEVAAEPTIYLRIEVLGPIFRCAVALSDLPYLWHDADFFETNPRLEKPHHL
jgi:hypothetical protein